MISFIKAASAYNVGDCVQLIIHWVRHCLASVDSFLLLSFHPPFLLPAVLSLLFLLLRLLSTYFSRHVSPVCIIIRLFPRERGKSSSGGWLTCGSCIYLSVLAFPLCHKSRLKSWTIYRGRCLAQFPSTSSSSSPVCRGSDALLRSFSRQSNRALHFFVKGGWRARPAWWSTISSNLSPIQGGPCKSYFISFLPFSKNSTAGAVLLCKDTYSLAGR